MDNPLTKQHRLLITPGEPAGIGPDITLLAAHQPCSAELIVVADPDLLRRRANVLGLAIQLHDWQANQPFRGHEPGHLFVIPVTEKVKSEAGVLNPGNAEYVLETLNIATALALKNQAHAIVTGPVHKGTMNRGGVAFTGHTEYLARIADVPHTVMLFVVDDFKVALATTHLPLAQVPQALTKESLIMTLTTLHHDLQTRFTISSPHIVICGLNPHAGEGGYLGREEIDIISPVISDLRKQNYQLTGPLPADTVFTRPYLAKADTILAMYHDQALPLVKYIGFSQAVNVTLGLPFIRTSVDHGTAIDIAGTGKAEAGSILKAIKLAITLQ
jgi:4-hydroxythreonine-4-phosphate dehydrogenase